MVRRSATAEQDASVDRLGQVVHGEPVGGERLPPVPSHRPPLRFGERFGGDDQRVNRQHASPVAGKPRHPGLSGEYDRRCSNLTGCRPYDRLDGGIAWADIRDRGSLVDLHAAFGEVLGQPPGQPGRMHGSSVRVVETSLDACCTDTLARFGCAKPLEAGGPTELLEHIERVSEPGHLGPSASQQEDAPLSVVALDPRRPGEVVELIDGVAHGVDHLPGPIWPVPVGEGVGRQRHGRRRPSAVTAAGTKPDVLGLE